MLGLRGQADRRAGSLEDTGDETVEIGDHVPQEGPHVVPPHAAQERPSELAGGGVARCRAGGHLGVEVSGLHMPVQWLVVPPK